MAYVTPPTFVDGLTLSASVLNKLSDNQEYFKGIVDSPNVPFASVWATSDTTTYFWFRHTHRYLHWKFTIESGESDALWIKIYDSTGAIMFTDPEPFEDNGNYTVDQAGWTGSFDASALTIGDWYRAEVEIKFTGTGDLYLVYLEERTTA